jgi:uncharacterized protein DUF6527
MGRMRALLRLINRLLDQVLHRPSRLGVSELASISELPGSLHHDRIYLVGAGNRKKWAVLMCPCGCGNRIDVNLMRTRRPVWALTWHYGEVNLSPSLWRPRGSCGSHFWVRDSRIAWVHDTDNWAPR